MTMTEPQSSGFRRLVLAVTCLGKFGYNYCYDNVVALQDQLQGKYNLSNIQYNLLYSVYAFPNCVLPSLYRCIGIFCINCDRSWIIHT